MRMAGLMQKRRNWSQQLSESCVSACLQDARGAAAGRIAGALCGRPGSLQRGRDGFPDRGADGAARAAELHGAPGCVRLGPKHRVTLYVPGDESAGNACRCAWQVLRGGLCASCSCFGRAHCCIPHLRAICLLCCSPTHAVYTCTQSTRRDAGQRMGPSVLMVLERVLLPCTRLCALLAVVAVSSAQGARASARLCRRGWRGWRRGGLRARGRAWPGGGAWRASSGAGGRRAGGRAAALGERARGAPACGRACGGEAQQ